MLDSEDQISLITIGVLIKEKLPSININDFISLEELRVYLNYELNTNIEVGMLFTDVIKDLKNEI